MTKEKRPHHHGNLREALILAGMDLMVEGGPDALSLRKCAARAGVSHAAPAHHFKGLGSLQLAIVARGHALFAEFMIAERDKADAAPQAQLNAICAGYIKFSCEHSALFKFMFLPREIHPDLFDSSTWEQFTIDSSASYQVLRDACLPFENGTADGVATEVMVWSLVHGYAMLFSGQTRMASHDMAIPDFGQILPMLALKAV